MEAMHAQILLLMERMITLKGQIIMYLEAMHARYLLVGRADFHERKEVRNPVTEEFHPIHAPATAQ